MNFILGLIVGFVGGVLLSAIAKKLFGIGVKKLDETVDKLD
jgi:hypothetical protein